MESPGDFSGSSPCSECLAVDGANEFVCATAKRTARCRYSRLRTASAFERPNNGTSVGLLDCAFEYAHLLRESHREKLVTAQKVLYLVIAAVPAYTFLKLVGGQKIHPLRKNSSSGMHTAWFRRIRPSREEPKMPVAFRNRKKSNCHLSRCITSSYVDTGIRQPDSSGLVVLMG